MSERGVCADLVLGLAGAGLSFWEVMVPALDWRPDGAIVGRVNFLRSGMVY